MDLAAVCRREFGNRGRAVSDKEEGF